MGLLCLLFISIDFVDAVSFSFGENGAYTNILQMNDRISSDMLSRFILIRVGVVTPQFQISKITLRYRSWRDTS